MTLRTFPPWRTGATLRGFMLVGTLAALALSAGLAINGDPSLSVRAESSDGASQSVEVAYNGDFTFTRVRYGAGLGGGRGGSSAWSHDWPAADRNMQEILREFTSMRPNTSGSNVVDLENPEIFRHPILYMSEPGFWTITEAGAGNLGEYLLKGGFLIFDDFDGSGHWENWEAQMARVLPGFRAFEIGPEHPIFDTFFSVQNIYVPHPFVSTQPQYFGIFEDNTPSGRMLALVNYNADLAEYWEYAARGFFPVDPTNDAFRLGVNYLVYALTR